MKKRYLTYGSILLLLLTGINYVGCGGSDGPSNPEDRSGTTWTVVAYMAGNNNLDYSQNVNSFVIEDLQEMEKVGSSDKLNIIAICSSLKNGGDASIYHVEFHEDEVGDNISSTELAAWGQKDMSDPETLKDFLEYTIEDFQADRYMLIVDNHGSGWAGSCTDDPAGGAPMSLQEMKDAILEADVSGWDNHFDIVVFHACLMASAEVAYGLHEIGEYMLACQFMMPMESILASERWLGDLSEDLEMTPTELGTKIVQYIKQRAEQRDGHTAMSITDMKLSVQLASRIGDLSDVLPNNPNDSLWNEVLSARANTHITNLDDPATVDLREFIKNILQQPNLGSQGGIVEENAQLVLDTINEMVIYTTTTAIGITRGGLNIYLPYLEEQWHPDYSEIDFADNNWDQFVRNFINGVQSEIGGTLVINSNPAGATIFVGGEDTEAVTPAQFDAPEGTYAISLVLEGYQEWTTNASVQSGQTTTVNADLVPAGGGDEFTIFGDVAWFDNRPLTECYVGVYENIGGELSWVVDIPVAANGQYSMTSTDEGVYWFDVWDDVNGNGWPPDDGDGWNALDLNGNLQWPDAADGLEVSAGNSYNIPFTVYEVGSKNLKFSRIYGPLPKRGR